ncbi:MAG: hypothetical protein N2Z74_03515, partial [Syntrophales bacterium]|nr:hypothetical protein [Syntrophales bacterium]
SAASDVYKRQSLNSERPQYGVVRYFNADHPQGVELFRMSYDIGAIRKVYWAGRDVFYFLTSTDMPLSGTSPRLWKLSLP